MSDSTDDEEFYFASQPKSRSAVQCSDNNVQALHKVIDDQPCHQVLLPEVHVSARRIAEYFGRVVHADHRLLIQFSAYWHQLGRKLALRKARFTDCEMAVESEGVMLERSIFISKDESYYFPHHYQRTRPCLDKFSLQASMNSERKVSAGQFGTVYHAVDASSQARREPVYFAEKVIPLDKFNKNELDILCSIHHHHIIKVYGAIRTTMGVHIMMQLAPGGNIDHLLQAEKGFDGGNEDPHFYTEFWAMVYYKQIMGALVYLESIRTVHCDIKPRNVVLSSDHRSCFLTDFGEAQYIPSEKSFIKLKSGLVGTTYFMSPEVIASEEFYFASDVWSAACFLLNMLTGVSPWTKCLPEMGTYLFAIPQRPYQILNEIPPWIHSLTKSVLSSSFRVVSERKSANELHQLAEKTVKLLISVRQSKDTRVNLSLHDKTNVFVGRTDVSVTALSIRIAQASEKNDAERSLVPDEEDTVDGAANNDEVLISVEESSSMKSSDMEVLAQLLREVNAQDCNEHQSDEGDDENDMEALQELLRSERYSSSEVGAAAVIDQDVDRAETETCCTR